MRLFIATLIYCCVLTAVAADQGPVSVVSAVIQLDTYDAGPVIFSEKPSSFLRRYFTNDFVKTWDRAHSTAADGPGDDGDPISGYQGVKFLSIGQISTTLIDKDRAIVQTVLITHSSEPGGHNSTARVRFDLVRESGQWKIKDVGNAVYASLYNLLIESASGR